ncbi:MAG: bL21 family ribosomal protein, partial [Deltaproteobacteria bacterium]|nr:bL21 family ribosomal protein [Candidatus Anaeroferrophillacea bacterium]
RKILVFKSKRRKGSKKMRGHRQSLTEVKITGVSA